MYWIYSMVLGLGVLALSPLLLVRNSRDGRYTRFAGERLGRLRFEGRPAAGAAIWIHAVSVGEALAVERLIARLRERFPERPVMLSVTTAAGRAVAERRINADRVFYFPLDFRFAARRALRAVQPGLVLIVETEIWPNFLREAMQREIPVMFVNGRISGRSYARYRLVRRLLRPTLSRATAFLMQTPRDAERILDLGATPERVRVAGNLKFDLMPPQNEPLLRMLRERLELAGIGAVLVAGSTMEGEEQRVLAAYRALLAARRGRPGAPLLLVLAPRHPQRFERASGLIAAAGLTGARRSHLPQAALPGNGVLLLDSLGELASLYRLATAVFVGGSLEPHGGHNILEPAYWGVPVVFGPHMENFAVIAEQFLAAGAALRVATAHELARVWEQLLDDDERRRAVGGAALRLLAQERGATARALGAIESVLAGEPLAATLPGSGEPS